MLKNVNQETNKSFFIISYTVDGVFVPFFNTKDVSIGPIVSVIIGPNGSRKSTILASLIEELEVLFGLMYSGPKWGMSSIKRTHPITATIEYRYGENNYIIERNVNKLEISINGLKTKQKNIPLPSAAIAVAHLPTDKFRFSNNFHEDFYIYLGLRQATNLTTTGALEAKILSSLLAGFGDKIYRTALNKWLQLLSLDGIFEIEFDGLPRRLFDVKTFEELSSILGLVLKERWDRLKVSQNPKVATYTFENFFEFLELLRNSFYHTQSNKISSKVSGKVNLTKILEQSSSEREKWETGIEVIRRLRLSPAINLQIFKNSISTQFSKLSSGEQQILGTITRLLGHIRPGSIIVIDEPEVSLHPSWQMRYIPTLLSALKHVPMVHVIIATHSHFLVADLDPENSSLTIATGNSQKSFEIFDGALYGRSPENILYRVFGVGAVSNFYVEQDLANALKMISHENDRDIDELVCIQSRLKRVAASDNPAFSQILLEIDKFLELQNHD